jgi:hypothetical protein
VVNIQFLVEVAENKPKCAETAANAAVNKLFLRKNVLAENCFSVYYPSNPGNPKSKLLTA